MSSTCLPSDKKKLVISGSFTIDGVKPSLSYLFDLLDLPLTIHLTPYHQVFQELTNPASASRKNQSGINTFLIRVEDFIRDYKDASTLNQHISKIVGDLAVAFEQYSNVMSAMTMIALLPPSPNIQGDLYAVITTLTESLKDKTKTLSGFFLLENTDFDSVQLDFNNGYDAFSDELAHIPFSEQSYAALALAIARKTHAMLMPAKKVLVLDCDNTLWQGVVGEEGIEGITLPESCLALQRFAINVQQQGGLICLASKNSESDVLDVLQKRSDMLLKQQHIIAHKINWEYKAKNIKELADELNLGLDSFVFIDDNPVECAQVQSELPMVVTLQLPSEPYVDTFLKHLWLFDKLSVTDEDVRRTQMYRENYQRQQAESSTKDIAAFLASLDLEIHISPPEQDEWTRLAQLTQRTNQFNFTTIRRSELDLKALSQVNSAQVLSTKVKDRFGDYGVVGLIITRSEPDHLVIDTLLLSCRVLGRGVEHAMLRYAADYALTLGKSIVELPFVPTAKNEPAQAFADHVALEFKEHRDNDFLYRIPATFASQIQHVPGGDPQAILEAKQADSKKKTPAAATTNEFANTNISERHARLVNELVNGAAVCQAIKTQNHRKRNLSTPIINANSQVEQELQELWQELLDIESIGIEDDYFALGGTSLLTARLFAELGRRYKTNLRMTTILEAPTIKQLAQVMQIKTTTQRDILVMLKPGNKQALFLVHDGDGETLLYQNLANRMPDGLAVYGIEPRTLPRIPMAHSSIDDMASYYVNAIKQKQPIGPYYLSGMCAGGLIAYVMAEQLIKDGEKVAVVAILDAATPDADKRIGRITKARLNRLSKLFSHNENASNTRQFGLLVKRISVKILNTLRWELGSRLKSLLVKLKFKYLALALQHNYQWPFYLPELSVREIYNTAEKQCSLKPCSHLKILLVRAKQGVLGDTPYKEIYSDELLGWGRLSQQIRVVDVDGGHSSMLQEPYVQSLATVLLEEIHND